MTNTNAAAHSDETQALKAGARASWVMLFLSTGTLLCCALPALLVTLGLGAALAGLITAVPQLVWFSEHKDAFFAFAAVMLAAGGVMQVRARRLPCPADAALAAACARTRRVSQAIYVSALSIYATGFFFAYLAVYLL